MSGLQHLRQRRQAVQSSQKITAAMKMIAISRMRKLSPLYDAAKTYKQEWGSLLADVLSATDNHYALPLLRAHALGQKALYVLCGSNRGLCGSFNHQLGLFFQQSQSQERTSSPPDYWVFGLKMKDYARDLSGKVVRFQRATDFVQMPEIQRYVSDILSHVKAGLYHSVYLVFTRFDSFLSLKPALTCVIPTAATPDPEPRERPRLSVDSAVEEWSESVVAGYLGAELYEAFVSQALSEQVSRMRAMDAATNNAHSMIESLTLQYNRKRQESITNELIEIISGAESMKEKSHA